MYSSELEGKPVIGYVKRANKKLNMQEVLEQVVFYPDG